MEIPVEIKERFSPSEKALIDARKRTEPKISKLTGKPVRPYSRNKTLEDFIQVDNKTLRTIKSHNNERNYFAQNINPTLQKTVIDNARVIIAQNQALQAKMKPDYDTLEGLYLDAKKEFDNIRIQWEQLDANTLEQENIIRVMQGAPIKESPVKKYQTETTADESGAPVKKQNFVRWVVETEQVLKRMNHFMSLDELWDEFRKNTDLVNAANQSKTGFERLKLITVVSLKTHANRPENEKVQDERTRKRLVEYKDKFGLPEWLNDKGLPFPRYKTAFI